MYNRLSDARQEGDYIDFVYYTSEDVSDWIQEVKSFIEPCAGKLARTVLRGLWGWQQPRLSRHSPGQRPEGVRVTGELCAVGLPLN